MNGFRVIKKPRKAERLIGESMGYIVVGLKVGGVEVVGSVGHLRDAGDIRHEAMRSLLKDTVQVCTMINAEHARRVVEVRERGRAEEYKRKRSEELLGAMVAAAGGVVAN